MSQYSDLQALAVAARDHAEWVALGSEVRANLDRAILAASSGGASLSDIATVLDLSKSGAQAAVMRARSRLAQ